MNWGPFWLRGAPQDVKLLRPSTPKPNNLRAYSFRSHTRASPSSGARVATLGNILSTFFFSSRESFEVTVSGGSTFARVKLKEIDGMAPQDVERAV